MLASFSAFEMMVEEAYNREGSWLFEYEEIERIGELQREFGVLSPDKAIKELKVFIQRYFRERNLVSILEISLNPPKVRIVSQEGAKFILAAKSYRGNVGSAKDFEDLVTTQLSKKLTGKVMCVGFPRKNKSVAVFREKLLELGVDITGHKKVRDGGLDILWVLPLGKKSEIPFVNFQCKNTETLGDDVKASESDARKTLSRHKLFSGEVFSIFVVANTYLTDKAVEDSRGRGFVYLGLPELLTCRNLSPPPVFL